MENTELVKCRKYHKYSSREKAKIEKRAAKFGITAMIML